MRQIFIFMLIALSIQGLFSQTYIPLDTANLEVRKQVSTLFLANEKLFYKELSPEYKGGERSLIKKRFEAINKAFNEDILKGQFVFDPQFDKLVDSIMTEIKAGDSILPSNFKFYISRNLPLNAASFGNKNFVLNMGTFCYLQNDDQLAAIISHEIGHYLLKHTIKNIQHHYFLNKSSEIKEEIYALKNEKNNQGAKAYTRLKNLLYEDGRLNKHQELEADSMGYEIYRKTRFKKSEYLNNLRLSEMYDTIRPLGLDVQTYKKVFNLPQLPFKEEWLKKEDFSNYDYSGFKDRYNEDSISSHPETEERIATLKKLFPELQKMEESKDGSPQFMKLHAIARYERLPSLMFEEEYGVGVYGCLLGMQEDEKDAFSTEWLGKFFEKIYDARKHYTLNRYLDRIDPKNQSESYQQFLSFIWNLNLSDIKVITDYYNKKGS
jgi:hypothetical protein